MDINKETKHLEKKIGILEMLKQAKRKKTLASEYLDLFRRTKDRFSPIRLFSTEQELVSRVAHWDAVILRIEKYYQNQ